MIKNIHVSDEQPFFQMDNTPEFQGMTETVPSLPEGSIYDPSQYAHRFCVEYGQIHEYSLVVNPPNVPRFSKSPTTHSALDWLYHRACGYSVVFFSQ